MCLEISYDSKKLVGEATQNNQPIIAWKVVYLPDSQDLLLSVWRNYSWGKMADVINKEFFSGRQDIQLEDFEYVSQKVYEGFHCYTSKQEALSEETNLNDGFYLMKVSIQPKDIIAFGNWGRNNTVACTHLTVLELTPI